MANELQTGCDEPTIHTMTTEIQDIRIAHDRSPARMMTAVLKGDRGLFRHFLDTTTFGRGLTDRVVRIACERAGAGGLERP